MKHSTVAAVTAAVVLLSGCGGGGGGEVTSVPGHVVWSASSNGSTVLDENGSTFYFAADNGCMYSTVNDIGPSGFCLTNPSGVPTGPTNCSNPGTNTACDTASFRVWYTDNGSGGCMAVLGSQVQVNWYPPGVGSPTTYTQIQPMKVTQSSTFSIQTYKTLSSSNAAAPTAYPAYWNAWIPSCNALTYEYKGSYTLQTAASCTEGPLSSSTWVYSSPVTLDTAGVFVDDGSHTIFGRLDSAGQGWFYGRPSSQSGGTTRYSLFSITSLGKNGSNKWVFSGTYSPQLVPAGGCTNFSGTWTATQN